MTSSVISPRINKKVEGGIGIQIGYLFNAHPMFKRGYHTTCRAVIVAGTTIGRGDPPPIPLVIRALSVA